MTNELIEQLAAIEHERWADWMRYFFSKCEKDPETKCLVIPFGYEVALWELIHTRYGDLSEDQKENDRREVKRYIHLIRARAT